MTVTAIPIPDPANDKPPRLKRWIPVSLKLFVVFLLLLGVGSALWIGVPAYRQYVAIREIERAGGTVYTRPSGPQWPRRWLGDEWMKMFDQSDEVKFDGQERATDAVLGYVGQLKDLSRRLDVSASQITDAGLAQLTELNWTAPLCHALSP